MTNISVILHGAEKYWAKGLKGSKVPIAIVDTGASEHVDHDGRIIKELDYVNEGTTKDRQGHSTHCAGIAAGNGKASSGKFRGFGVEAPLVFSKVLDQNGQGSLFSVLQGSQGAADFIESLPLVDGAPQFNGHRVGVISLSLGGYQEECMGECMLCKAMTALWDRGHIVVVAAGNNGQQKPPLNGYKYANSTICCPARANKIISVAASWCDPKGLSKPPDHNSVMTWSARGPRPDGYKCPTIAAYGAGPRNIEDEPSHIHSCAGGRSAPDYKSYVGNWTTSMATPHVAGACALIWSKHPEWTNDQIKNALIKYAEAHYKESLGNEANFIEGAGLMRLPDDGDGEPRYGKIYGKVIEKDQSAAIKGATLILDSTYSTSSNANGDYVFDDVRAGGHEVLCKAKGFKDSRQTVTVAAGDIKQVDFILEAESGQPPPPKTLRISIDGKEYLGDKVEAVKA